MVTIYSNIQDLTEVSTGLYSVQFKDGTAEVSDETANHLLNFYPGKFDLNSPVKLPKKKDE